MKKIRRDEINIQKNNILIIKSTKKYIYFLIII